MSISKVKIIAIIYLILVLILLVVSFLPTIELVHNWGVFENNIIIYYGYNITFIPLILHSISVILILYISGIKYSSEYNGLLLTCMITIILAKLLLRIYLAYRISEALYCISADHCNYIVFHLGFYLVVGSLISLIIINILIVKELLKKIDFSNNTIVN